MNWSKVTVRGWMVRGTKIYSCTSNGVYIYHYRYAIPMLLQAFASHSLEKGYGMPFIPSLLDYKHFISNSEYNGTNFERQSYSDSERNTPED